jgi:hypothetical protein
MLLTQQGIYEGIISVGQRLAELPEAEGGWSEYFDEDAGLGIKDDMLRGQTAIMLENTKRWMAQACRKRLVNGRLTLDEATRSALVGGFSDYLYPIIRAAFPTNPINDLISVQPTAKRTATMVYWNWVVGSKKGSYQPGQRLFDANTGKQDKGYNFSNEVIDSEAVGALSSANATVTGTLAFHDGGGVRPGTVRISATSTAVGAVVFTDNGQGGLVQIEGTAVTIAASTINYATGVFLLTLTGDTFTTAAVYATYRWNSEGSSMSPQVDIQITTSTTETERRAILLNFSVEAMQDVQEEFGVSLEPNIVSGGAEQMNCEIARQIISEIWAVAPVTDGFNLTGPVGYSRTEHFKDLMITLNAASNTIWARTQKGYGNWIVVDQGAANLIESLSAPLWQAAPAPASVQGLHFIGTLNGKFRVYKDLQLSKEVGASIHGNMLMGFKGSQFFEAGYVWSPYRMLYSTPTLQTADFMNQKGMASRYATKMANPNMYVRIPLGA